MRTLTLAVPALILAAPLLSGCDRDEAGPEGVAPRGRDQRLSREELERGRLDPSWKRYVQIDTTVAYGDTTPFPEGWEEISPGRVNGASTVLPVSGDVAGPSVLRVQILLDRAFFSPGVMDGRWGKNTEKAVYWFQRREGLPATGVVDSVTFERLAGRGGDPGRLVRAHRLTAGEVAGPFVDIPEDIYDQAELECMCYESLGEKLAETFHATPELLEKLNPGRALNSLRAGQTISVPNVRDPAAASAARVGRLVVSDGGGYLHAEGESGELLFHFPSTLGSQYNPSPDGRYRVVSITEEPWWHYQPELLTGEDPNDPDAKIPPGPNNAVGVVWMALSKEHYGIHGTSDPSSIGYATSSGCIRLTNWDARFLGRRIGEGVPVLFRDT
ncbi:MAG: L,D-transpeptidase family protein [Longimicrobiaceae bacterium]